MSSRHGSGGDTGGGSGGLRGSGGDGVPDDDLQVLRPISELIWVVVKIMVPGYPRYKVLL